MSRTAVVLFTGDARREEAQKGLRPRFLASIHDSLARAIRRVAGVDLLIASDRDDEFRIGGRLVHATTLGDKIEQAFSSARASGYERVIVLAGDIVLPPATLERAIAELQSYESVIGPSPDGGFYLIGFNGAPRVDWNAVAWFTSHAFDDVVAQLGTFASLPELRDVDSLDDARAVAPSLINNHVIDCRREIVIPLAPPLRSTQLRAPPR